MSTKSRELDKKLAEILTPYGFKRGKGTRCFLRLWGEDTVQYIAWEYERVPNIQCLNCTTESLFWHPSHLFQEYIQFKNRGVLVRGISCADEHFSFEYDVVRQNLFLPEEEQLVVLQQEVLPRFDRWKTTLDVICFHMHHFFLKADKITRIEDARKPYISFNEIDLALYLHQYNEVLQCIRTNLHNIAARIEQEESWIDDLLKQKRRCRSEKRIAKVEEEITGKRIRIQKYKAEIERLKIIKGWILEDPERIEIYLQRVKEQNMRDYEAVMNNLPGDNLEYWWPNKTKYSDCLKEDPKEMAKRYLACKNYYGN